MKHAAFFEGLWFFPVFLFPLASCLLPSHCSAEALQWECEWPGAKSQPFTLYHGETATFRPTFRINGVVDTNVTVTAVYIQTNGMGGAWWQLDNATFHPTNDVGAASYRFFVQAAGGRAAGASLPASEGILYRANGTLRMLESPGFNPAEISPPVRTLDFANIEVSNPPWTPEIAAATNTLSANLAATNDYLRLSGGMMDENATIEMYSHPINHGPKPLLGGSSYMTLDGYGMVVEGSSSNTYTEYACYYIRNGQDALGDSNPKIYLPTVTNEAVFATDHDIASATNATLSSAAELARQEVSSLSNSLSQAIASAQPADYATVSNRAMTAVQTLPAATTSAAGIVQLSASTNDTSSAKAATANAVKLVREEVGAVAASLSSDLDTATAAIWNYVLGDTAWIAITNYMRTAEGVIPTLQFWEVREGATNLVYDSREEITNTVNDVLADFAETVPTNAWSHYQSMTGAANPQPETVTIVSTPTVMLTGGGEWTRYAATGGESVWVLQSNGLTSFGTTGEGSFFAVLDDEGNAQFEVRRTDSYEVDAMPESTGWDGDDFVVTYNATGEIPPTLYCGTNLTEFVAEDASHEINALGTTVSWAKDANDKWAATMTQDVKAPALFCHAKALQEGMIATVTHAPAAFDGGILISNAVYRVGTATISGHTVLTLEAP